MCRWTTTLAVVAFDTIPYRTPLPTIARSKKTRCVERGRTPFFLPNSHSIANAVNRSACTGPLRAQGAFSRSPALKLPVPGATHLPT